MKKKSIFRERALKNRFSSSEHLDELIDVTAPRSWLVLGSVLALLSFAITWSFLGSIPTKISGAGIIMGGGDIIAAESSSSGRVSAVLIQQGDYVSVGQIIARLDQAELHERFQQARETLEEVEKELAGLKVTHLEEKELKFSNISAQKKRLEEQIKISLDQTLALEDEIANMEVLVEQGFATIQGVRQRKSELNTGLFRIADARAQIERLNSDKMDILFRQKREFLTVNNRANVARRGLGELEGILNRDSTIKSPVSGRVIEIKNVRGSNVTPGTRIASIEEEGSGLRAVVFLTADEAKNVSTGMQVNLAPATVRRDELGTLIGNVASISKFPITREGMKTILGNDTLVSQFGASSPTYLVEVLLQVDQQTLSGYRWSSGEGPQFNLSAGTLLGAEVRIREHRPIDLVIPALRRISGLDK